MQFYSGVLLEAVQQAENTVSAAQAASVIAADVVEARPQVAIAAAAVPAVASIASSLIGAAAAESIKISGYQSYGLSLYCRAWLSQQSQQRMLPPFRLI